MYDIYQYKNQQISAGNRKVIWFFDDTHHAAELLSDNLFICDNEGNELWNMREVIGHEDTCVLLRMEDENKMYFVTFNGIAMWVNTETLEILKETIQK